MSTLADGCPDRIVPMRVVVCGVHRTGTLSMQRALMQLGFHDCHHMDTLFNDLSKAPLWARAFEAKFADREPFQREDWDKLLGDCQACCDLPSAAVASEIALAYPEAKVVILNRDPEAWYESVLHTIYPTTRPKQLWPFLRMLYCFIFDESMRNMAVYGKTLTKYVLPYDHGKEKEKALAWFKGQYAEYREHIPAERCIEYNIKDGWKPLCDHLGVPVPMVKDEKTGKMVEAPFPRLNDRDAFFERTGKLRAKSIKRANENAMRLISKLTLLGALGFSAFLSWKIRVSR